MPDHFLAFTCLPSLYKHLRRKQPSYFVTLEYQSNTQLLAARTVDELQPAHPSRGVSKLRLNQSEAESRLVPVD